MVNQYWTIDTITKQFLFGGFCTPVAAIGQSSVILPGEEKPDRDLERYDATSSTGRRLATPQELLDAQMVRKAAQFTATSRQKDTLATCALIVRARGITAWNAMTLQQKVTATLAEADVWVTIRQFIETNI